MQCFVFTSHLLLSILAVVQVVNAKCVYGVRMLWIPKLASDRNLEAAADWVGDAAEGANASKGLAAVYRQWQQTVDREKKAAEAARLQLEQDEGYNIQ